MHANQLNVSVEVVRRLVGEQFPQWRGLPVTGVAGHGTVNAVFRVGDRLAARFPLVAGDVDAVGEELAREAERARELFGRTRFPTPEPVAIGAPGPGYPLPWAVQTWVPGVVATDDDPGGSVAFAHDLAELIAGVRAIGTGGRAFGGRGRGGTLRSQDDWVRTCLERSEGLLDVPRLRQLWRSMRDLPRGPEPDALSHGDLMPGNLLVSAGGRAGVRAAGGLGPADPALDLVGAWHLLDAAPRRALREDLGCGDEQWSRGRAWAFAQSMGLVWYYERTNPVMAGIGRRTLARIVSSAEPDASTHPW